MNRGLGLILGLLVIFAALFAGWFGSNRKLYFDPALYRGSYPCSLDANSPRGPVDEAAEGWFGAPLRAVDEPSLYLDPPPAGTTTVRFTFLPAFADPVIVRLDDLYGDRARITAHRVRHEVIRRPGPNLVSRDLTADEATRIRSFLTSTKVLDLPPDTCVSGVDGEIFLIEARGPDGYRFINRWGAFEGPVYELGNMLFQLTGWPNGLQGPDRSWEAHVSQAMP